MNEFSLKEILSAEDIQVRVKQLAREIDNRCQKEGIENNCIWINIAIIKLTV